MSYDVVHACKRALEESTKPAIKIMRYEREEMGKVSLQSDDTRLTLPERYANATAIIRFVERLPAYEQAVVLGLAGDPVMKEAAIPVLLDLVDRDRWGEGPARDAIRNWLGAKSMSLRQLSREYGGKDEDGKWRFGKDSAGRYIQWVAGELDAVLLRAVAIIEIQCGYKPLC